MPIDNNEITPTKISNFVQTQFPELYRQHGPVFVAFVRAYYEWLEQTGNTLYYSRRFYEINDVDATLDEFIIHFKNKYLNNIQLDTQSNTRLLIKHALDIYRSKGTERGVELLFQLVYNQPALFYYPSQDLFKLSDGNWYRPYYLELTLSQNNILLVNKEVSGLVSGATAFCYDVVRRVTNDRLIDVAYIDVVNNNFMTGEKIQPIDKSLDVALCPVVCGSLSEIKISSIGSGNGYSNGDVVTIQSSFGSGAKGTVANTTVQDGVVQFSLVDGGYGFSNSANLYIANSIVQISNVQITDYSYINYIPFKDTITQPLASIQYANASGLLSPGDAITTYYGNGSVMGTGVILTLNSGNSSVGNLICSILSGNLNNTFYTSSNIISSDIAANGFHDVTATGTYIGDTGTVVLVSNTPNPHFVNGEIIIQGASYGTLQRIDGSTLTISNIYGKFRPDIWVIGATSNVSVYPKSVQITIGMLANTNKFIGSQYTNYVSGSSMNGQVSVASASGSGASVQLGNTILQETVQYNTDILGNYANVYINANAYGFPANSTANLTNGTIGSCFTMANVTIGKISHITQTGTGQNYQIPPVVTLDEPKIFQYRVHDNYALVITAESLFPVYEEVTQAATGARGTVLAMSNSSVLYIQQNHFYPNNNFVTTTNSTTTIVGSTTGITANVTYVAANPLSKSMGHNMVVNSAFSIGNGVVTTITLTDSGFGFLDGETVSISGNNSNNAIGTAVVAKQGLGSGYYRSKGGFLSDQKKLFDGVYYQHYSYEIISGIMLNKYKQMLNQISHLPGTAMFGRYVHSNHANVAVSVSRSNITVS